MAALGIQATADQSSSSHLGWGLCRPPTSSSYIQRALGVCYTPLCEAQSWGQGVQPNTVGEACSQGIRPKKATPEGTQKDGHEWWALGSLGQWWQM